MKKEITNELLAVLFVIAIVVSLAGTYLVLSNVVSAPIEITIPQSSDSGVINLYVMPEPADEDAQVTLNVVNNSSEEGTP